MQLEVRVFVKPDGQDGSGHHFILLCFGEKVYVSSSKMGRMKAAYAPSSTPNNVAKVIISLQFYKEKSTIC